MPVEGSHQFRLLERLGEAGFSASILSTYNVYFPFFEDVVLRRLQSAGCTHNILMMDSTQAAAAYADPTLRPRRAGIDYTLIPVPSVFHPKVLLRVGRRKGALYVGSHNLTIAGFGTNHELSNHFDYAPNDPREAVVPFRAALDALRPVLPATLSRVGEAFDAVAAAAPWLAGPLPLAENVQVLGTLTDPRALWTRVRGLVEGAVERVLVVGPYFDDDLGFLVQLQKDMSISITVAVDPSAVELDGHRAAKHSNLRFVDLSGRLPESDRRKGHEGFLHAKALWIQTSAGELLVTGSANASAAAWLYPRERRNAEIVVVRWSSGTRSLLLEEAQLQDLLDSPEVSEAAWLEIQRRYLDREPASTSGASTKIVGAEITDDGILIDHPLDHGAHATIEDDGGRARAEGVVEPLSGGVGLRVSDDVCDVARTVRIAGSPSILAIVHHTAQIADLFASDTRKELRRALGRLDEDPAQVTELLDLLHRAIFDGEEGVTPVGSAGGHSRSVASADDEYAPGPESLEVEVHARRGTLARRRRIASGDIAAILDALIRRLGMGLEETETDARELEREEATADDDDGEADSAPFEPPEEIPPSEIAKACRRKVGQLVRRLGKQAAAAAEEGDPHAARRLVVQCDAVLAVLHKLRVEAGRDRWRRKGLDLLDERAMKELVQVVLPIYAAGSESLFGRAYDAEGSELFEELVECAALFAWVAWEVDVGLDRASARNGQVGVAESLWPDLQCLAFLAPWLDAGGHDLARRSVERTPRTRADATAWLQTHLPWLADIAEAEARASDDSGWVELAHADSGDLVRMPKVYDPRVRVVQLFEPKRSGGVVTVMMADGTTKTVVKRVVRRPALAGVLSG